DFATATETSVFGELHGLGALAVDESRIAASSLGLGIGWKSKTDGSVGRTSTRPFVAEAMALSTCGILWRSLPNTINLSGYQSGLPAPLVNGVRANRVAADEAAVYWTDSSGAVGKIPYR